MTRRRILVTGFGVVSPLGVGADALIDRWCEGESGIAEGLGACSDFDPADFLPKKEIRRYDRVTQLAIVAADEALRRAGWSDEGFPVEAERIGCVIGTGSGGSETMQSGWEQISAHGDGGISALFVPRTMPNAAAAFIAIRHGILGPSVAVSSACSSGGDAIADGMRMLRLGEVDAMVVGGAEAQIVRLTMAAFRNMGALSPSGVSRPFDAHRDGFVMGEGAGVLVLEDAEVAERRGARILGELLGYGVTNDSYNIVAPDPEGKGAVRALRRALEDAELTPDDVDYVNAHGTSTPVNDRSETLALKEVFGERAADVPVSSLKSAIGHLIGAAGAVEAGATLQALQRRVLPPTLNYEFPDEELDLDYIPNQARPLNGAAGDGRHRPVALSNSFGFGGHNCVLAVGGVDGGAGG
jgi:3-oxoacyl-[acyl-carrier-protein] synthase II